MNDMKERIIWLDYFRVLAIYFVVVSHTPVSADFNLPLTYIRMPFFFLCSGLMFNIDKEVDFIVFLKKKAHSLLIPFVTFHAISYPFWLIFDRNFGADVSNAYPWYEPLPDIFLGRFAIDDAPLWFLTALFATEIIYYLLARCFTSKYLFVLLPIMVVVGYLSQAFIDIELPFMLQTVAIALIFYGLGNIFKKQIFAFGKKHILFMAFIIVCGIISVLKGYSTIPVNVTPAIGKTVILDARTRYSRGWYLLKLLFKNVDFTRRLRNGNL